MKLIILSFIIFSSFIGSIKKIFNKKYIYDSFPTIQFQIIDNFLKFISSSFIFLLIYIYNKSYNKTFLNSRDIKKLNNSQLFYTIIGIFITTINSLISKEIFRKSNNYTFVTITFSILSIIFGYIFDAIYFNSKISTYKTLSIIWIIIGIIFLYITS